jgi:hypothetical protein
VSSNTGLLTSFFFFFFLLEIKKKKKSPFLSQGAVARTYNPSYLGDRAQEDCSSKPTQQIAHKTLSQKYPTHPKNQKGLGNGSSGACLASMRP